MDWSVNAKCGIRVRSAIFSLSDDPEHAGRKFVKESLGIDVD